MTLPIIPQLSYTSNNLMTPFYKAWRNYCRGYWKSVHVKILLSLLCVCQTYLHLQSPRRARACVPRGRGA